jgi:glycosyltransferase involved in cell wall biosynthesis
MKNRHLTAINANLSLGRSGGIETFLGALITALGNLSASNESYLLIGNSSNFEWLESIKGDNQTVLLEDEIRNKNRGFLRRVAAPLLGPVKAEIQRRLSSDSYTGEQKTFPNLLTVSDGFWENLECDTVHFPFQQYVICAKPTIYNPHDLQHAHFPEYFSAKQLAWRETMYSTGCRFARTIVTASQWVKDDIVQQYGTNPEKIQVIPWAPPTRFYSSSEETEFQILRERYGLPEKFILYPAVIWPHKNHIRLFEAIALLRDKHNLTVPLVCTGSAVRDQVGVLETHIRRLGLANQVHFLGFLPGDELRCMYQMCASVIVPTLFEAASGPVFEAWQEGAPVACSTVTSLPEQVGNAALLFDPESIEAIANAIRALFTNDDLCKEYSLKGRRRLTDFKWDRTAKAYRAVYRRNARQELTEEDQMLLSWDWMRNPNRDAHA